jgi:hypothetical protein
MYLVLGGRRPQCICKKLIIMFYVRGNEGPAHTKKSPATLANTSSDIIEKPKIYHQYGRDLLLFLANLSDGRFVDAATVDEILNNGEADHNTEDEDRPIHADWCGVIGSREEGENDREAEICD